MTASFFDNPDNNSDNQGAETGLQEQSINKARLVDMFARTINYLRLSITDHCNLRCLYCTPQSITSKLPAGELLTFEELLRVVSLGVSLGIKKVRLTGGEPLVRRNVLSFIEELVTVPGLDDIRLTTNGVVLAEMADKLHAIGIKKVNISLDTLKPDRFQEITGVDCFDKVRRGIERAAEIGFSPVKINVVVLKGINDDEIVDFAQLSLTQPLHIRFIEFMPMGTSNSWEKEKYMPTKEIMARLQKLGDLIPLKGNREDGPARRYKLENSLGSIGFISPISNHFCDRCNRLRLTSEGKLRSCLLHDAEIDLKKIIRAGGSDSEIKDAIVQTVLNKPKGHELNTDGQLNCHGQMSRIGG